MLCPSCNAALPDTARFCLACGARIPEPASQPAPAAVAQEAQALAAEVATSRPEPAPAARPDPDRFLEQARPGGLLRRFSAFMLDGVLLVLMVAPAYLLAAGRWGTVTEFGIDLHGAPAAACWILSAAAGLAYFSIFEATLGATPAKLFLNLRVRSRSGGRPGFGAALVRSLLRPVDAFLFGLVGLVAALSSKRRQRLGDLAAGTLVVRGQSPAWFCALIGLAGLVAALLLGWEDRRVYRSVFKQTLLETRAEVWPQRPPG